MGTSEATWISIYETETLVHNKRHVSRMQYNSGDSVPCVMSAMIRHKADQKTAFKSDLKSGADPGQYAII